MALSQKIHRMLGSALSSPKSNRKTSYQKMRQQTGVSIGGGDRRIPTSVTRPRPQPSPSSPSPSPNQPSNQPPTASRVGSSSKPPSVPISPMPVDPAYGTAQDHPPLSSGRNWAPGVRFTSLNALSAQEQEALWSVMQQGRGGVMSKRWIDPQARAELLQRAGFVGDPNLMMKDMQPHSSSFTQPGFTK